MKITIEITSEELVQLVDRLHLKEVPCILDELHEDFQVEPDSETDGVADEKHEEPAADTPEPPEPTEASGRKCGRKAKKVDVLMSNGQWKMFESASAAGAYLGVPSCRVTTAISKGYRVKGFEVREHEDGDEEEDE